MVDPTNGVGSLQGISQANKSQQTGNDRRAEEEKRAEEARQAEPVDTVEISEEAVQKASQEASEALKRDENTTLGLNPSFVDEEV